MATNNNKGLNKIQKSMIDPDFVGEVDQLNQQLADKSDDLHDRGINVREFADLEIDGDFSPVVQTAFDSGYPIIEFPNWVKTLKNTVVVPPTVKEIRFNKAHLKFDREQNAVGASYSESMFIINGVDNLKITGGKAEYLGTFDFNNSYTGMVSALHVTDSDNFHVFNFEAFGFNRAGINIAPNTSDVYCKNPVVEKCKLHHNRVSGLLFGNTEDISIVDNEMNFNGLSTDNGTGYGLAGSSSAYPRNTIVRGNRTNYNYRKGIDFHSGYNGIVESNYCVGNYYFGIFINYNGLKDMGDWIIKDNIISDMINDPSIHTLSSVGIAIGSYDGQGANIKSNTFLVQGNKILNIGSVGEGTAVPIILYGEGMSKGVFEIKDNTIQADVINSFITAELNVPTNKGNYYDVSVIGNNFKANTCKSTGVAIQSISNRITKFEGNTIEITSQYTMPNLFFYGVTTVPNNMHTVLNNIVILPTISSVHADIWGIRRTEREKMLGNILNGQLVRSWDGRRFLYVGKPGESTPSSGYWTVGSIVDDMDIAAGQFSRWICSGSGTPGTWIGTSII